jgi:bifunctional DNase/RNase
MVEMTVDSVRFSRNQQRVVILKDQRAERYLLIWIGQDVSAAIAHQLQGASFPRPLTHDLLKTVITQMGGRVLNVTISELRQTTFHGYITIEVHGRRIEVDARPSDAIALAVRVHCPIYVAEAVLDAAAVVPEEIEGTAPRTGNTAPTADDLAIYRDFINNLDILDDFGKD